MKVWLFYYENKIYGYTADRKIKNKFKLQRNMKKFKIQKINLSDERFKTFNYVNNRYQLIDNALYSKDGYTSIITTIEEDTKVTEFCDALYKDVVELTDYFVNVVPFKTEYFNALSDLLQILEYDNTIKEIHYKFDTFFIYVHLFGEFI